MATEIISNPARVWEFVNRYTLVQATGGMKGLGLLRDGEMVAGAIFDSFNGRNVWVHLAAVPGKRWLNRDFLHYAFHYAFNEMKVDRISGWVEASNLEARKFDEHIGYKREAVLKGAASDGGDVFIYVMRREDCKYV